jgi:hypothetical protein
MSRALELVQLAKEGNASRFGDLMVAGIQEKVVAAVQAKRARLSEGENPFAKKDDDKDEDEDDKDDKKSKSDDDDDKDEKSKDKSDDDDGDDD